jgi:hypothetical protein
MATADGRGWYTPPKWVYSLGQRAGRLADRVTKNNPDEKNLEGLEKGLAKMVRVFGPDGGPTANARAAVATMLERMDRLDEAATLREEVLAANRYHLGAEHVRSLMAEMCLASNLIRQDRADEAKPLLRHVIEVRQRTLGPNADGTNEVEKWLANIESDADE